MEIEFRIALTEQDAADADPLLDEVEVALLLDSTRAQFRQHIQQRLGALTCDAHQQAPKVIVEGTYSLATEQLDVSYSIEACCNTMTMRAAALLSRM
ncbi:MAG: hypothetical protein H7Y11_14595 [Armatimonadetes bacterium]|nr:hypothetical protein [Anaerolineae bacterium]